MRTIGTNSGEIVLPGKASGDLLKQGAAFNESLQEFFPSGKTGYIPKGLYRFMTHADANHHQEDCLAMHIARMTVNARNSNG